MMNSAKDRKSLGVEISEEEDICIHTSHKWRDKCVSYIQIPSFIHSQALIVQDGSLASLFWVS
jgi:hypothetical protein